MIRTEVKLKVDTYVGGTFFKKGSRVTVLKDQGTIGVLVENPNKNDRKFVPTLRLFNHELCKPKVA